MRYKCWHRWWKSEKSEHLLVRTLRLVLATPATHTLGIRHFSQHLITYPRVSALLSLAIHC